MLRLIALFAATLLLAACSSTKHTPQPTSGYDSIPVDKRLQKLVSYLDKGEKAAENFVNSFIDDPELDEHLKRTMCSASAVLISKESTEQLDKLIRSIDKDKSSLNKEQSKTFEQYLRKSLKLRHGTPLC